MSVRRGTNPYAMRGRSGSELSRRPRFCVGCRRLLAGVAVLAGSAILADAAELIYCGVGTGTWFGACDGAPFEAVVQDAGDGSGILTADCESFAAARSDSGEFLAPGGCEVRKEGD